MSIRLQGMGLMSQSGSSHCMHSEVIQCKYRHNGVNGIANTMEGSKTKEIFFGSSSPTWSSLKATRSGSLGVAEVRQRRHHRLTVTASPPTEDAVVAAEPLTKDDLVNYLASGCKPKEKWRFNF